VRGRRELPADAGLRGAAAVALAGMPLAGKIVSLPLVSLNGFLLSKFWIFK
jgi:hypothetical protein